VNPSESEATRRSLLRGGEASVWDEVSTQNLREVDENGLYPLRSAPERAILAAVMDLADVHAGSLVAELGCGQARYLPYLARDRGARVFGVDFSVEGIEQTRRALRSIGAESDGLERGDLHEYCPRHHGEFDATISFGLIEHFSDLQEIIDLHLLCTRPGGRVFVSAPNLSGPNLRWARRTAPSVLAWHCEISAERVVAAFRARGAAEVRVAHLGGPRLFAYPDGQAAGRTLTTAARTARRLVNGAGELVYRLAPGLATRAAGPRWSPYFAVAATKARA
jgi:SAM-dependent methyltransferase